MKVSLRMPRLSMNMEEGVIVQWHRSVGDRIAKGEALYTVETEKASADVEAPFNGVVSAILAEVGASVPVGDHVCVLETP